MWLTHFWHSWSQFFIFAWDVTAGGILRTGVLICLVGSDIGLSPVRLPRSKENYRSVIFKSWFIFICRLPAPCLIKSRSASITGEQMYFKDFNSQNETHWCHNNVNPLRAKFFRVNINIYLHFVSFIHIDMTQVLEILPQAVYDFKYFHGLPFGLFEFSRRSIARLNFVVAIYFNYIEKIKKFQYPCGLQDFKIP